MTNIAALSVAQGLAYILPLFTLPYTAAVLGPKSFGILALTQAVVQYSTLVTNYGFAYSATRLAAVHHAEPERLAELVVNVWAAKATLMLVCLVASLAVFTACARLRPEMGAYLCGFASVVGSVLCLDWFFQAIEEMKWITVINVVPRLVFTPLIFILVKTPFDYGTVLLCQSAAAVCSGIGGGLLACRRLPVRLPMPTLRGIAGQLKDGWRTFVATVCINVYAASSTVLLGLLTNVTLVGYYSAGQKVVLAIQSLWAPVSQAIYPHFCKSFHDTPQRAAMQLRRLCGTVLSLTLAGAVGMFLLAPWFVPIYLGSRYASSVGVIRVLIFSICAVTTNSVLGLHGLLAAGLHKSFVQVVAAAALASSIMAPLAILWGGCIGLAISTVVIEASIGVREYRILRGKGLI